MDFYCDAFISPGFWPKNGLKFTIYVDLRVDELL